MLLKLRTFLKSYRASGGAAVLVVLVLLLCATMLSLTMLFSGSSNLSDTLISSIPLEFAFERTHYFEQYYSLDELGEEYLHKNADVIRAMSMATKENSKDEDPFPHHKTNIAKEERRLESFLSGLDELARDPAVKYASYNLHYFLGMKDCAAEGFEPGYYGVRLGTVHVCGINGFDFFEHNHISFVEVEEDSFSDDAAYVHEEMRIRGEDGQMRPIRIGDRIELESLGGSEQYGSFTVKGIFRSFSKFDYSYGTDGAYLVVNPAMYVPNAALRQIHPMENVNAAVAQELPHVYTIVFDIRSLEDYDGFYEKLSDFAKEMETHPEEFGVKPMKLEVQTPPYLKMAGTISQTTHYYSLVMWIIDGMLLILSGGLIFYLLLGKRREMFLLHSLGMSKIRIAGRYLAYFLLPVLLTALAGIAPGLVLNRLLCTRIASQIFSMENELLRFSSSGNQILTAARESIQTFAVKGRDILQAFGFTVLVTAAVSGIIVFFGTLLQLRGNIRARIRSREL